MMISLAQPELQVDEISYSQFVYKALQNQTNASQHQMPTNDVL